MPVYESLCRSCGRIKEWYVGHPDPDTNPVCDCGVQMVRLISRFAVVFTGPLTAKYNDKSVEGAHQEGHWAYRLRSSKSGHPEPVFIESFEQQKQFCKEEGLVPPEQCPNMDGTDDGRMTTRAGVGMPGAWV